MRFGSLLKWYCSKHGQVQKNTQVKADPNGCLSILVSSVQTTILISGMITLANNVETGKPMRKKKISPKLSAGGGFGSIMEGTAGCGFMMPLISLHFFTICHGPQPCSCIRRSCRKIDNLVECLEVFFCSKFELSFLFWAWKGKGEPVTR